MEIELLEKEVNKLINLRLVDLAELDEEDIVRLNSVAMRLAEVINLISKNRNFLYIPIREGLKKKIKPLSSDTSVYDTIKENPGLTSSQLQKVLPPGKVVKSIKSLETKGLILKKKGVGQRLHIFAAKNHDGN